jgi:hypothetical protein
MGLRVKPATTMRIEMDLCPRCSTPTEMGFGLAGGGYGAYQYCPSCEEIVKKWQEPDVEPGEPPHHSS